MSISQKFSKDSLYLRKLESKVEKLQKQLEFCQQLLRPNELKFEYCKHNLIVDVPVKEKISKSFHNTKDDTYFITITFDPQIIETIGLKTTELQKQYLLIKIEQFHNFLTNNTDIHITKYGCLEFQKNGTLHAHFLLQFQITAAEETYINELHEGINDLKYQFTDNVYNKRAIHWRPVDDLEKAIDYILKEPHTLYK